MNDRTEELARRVRNALGEFDDPNMPVVELVRDMAACLRKYDTIPKPEAQAAGDDLTVTDVGGGYLFKAPNGKEVYVSQATIDALSTPASHDAQHEAVTEHEGEFGLPPLPASAVYWRQRAEFWREQAVLLGWREKRDAENGEAQQPAVVGDGHLNPPMKFTHDEPMRALLGQAATELEALRKRCEAVEADAERYRYLRQNHVSEYESETPYDMSSPSLDLDFSAEGHDLDAAIDRVRGAAAQEPSHG